MMLRGLGTNHVGSERVTMQSGLDIQSVSFNSMTMHLPPEQCVLD